MTQDVFGIEGSVLANAYRVERAVAEGGFAVVYRAQHTGFRAPVAIKCLKVPGELRATDREAFLGQFRREAELVFRLSATLPGVVRPLHVDAFERAGVLVPFLVLEWLDGHTLEQVMRRLRARQLGQLPLSQVVQFLSPVARVLQRAHGFPGSDGPVAIAHRDLKPDNIFIADVAGETQVKLLDFGIGKVRNVATQLVGRQSNDPNAAAPFTPAYGAPEQWVPKRFGQTGPWTDVYALALIASELCVGAPVVSGDQAGMLAQCLDPERRPSPGRFGVRVSEPAERVLLRALALDPARRFPDAGAFWNSLLDVLGLAVDPPFFDPRRLLEGDEAPVSGSAPTLAMAPPQRTLPLAQPRLELAPTPERESRDAPIGIDWPKPEAHVVGHAEHDSPRASSGAGWRWWLILRPGALLLTASVAVSIGAQLYAAAEHQVLRFGGLRASWLAGGLLLLALLISGFRLLVADRYD